SYSHRRLRARGPRRPDPGARAQARAARRSAASCRDESPDDRTRLMTAPITDLPPQGVECLAAHANRADEFAKAPGRRLVAEVRLDHLGERLPPLLVRGQQSVRLEVDGDGVDGHALIVHLSVSGVKKLLPSSPGT